MIRIQALVDEESRRFIATGVKDYVDKGFIAVIEFVERSYIDDSLVPRRVSIGASKKMQPGMVAATWPECGLDHVVVMEGERPIWSSTACSVYMDSDFQVRYELDK